MSAQDHREVDEEGTVDLAVTNAKHADAQVTDLRITTLAVAPDRLVQDGDPASFLEQAIALQQDVDEIPAEATKKVRRLTPTYLYRATVVRWVDGDTLDVDVDLGFHMTANLRVRLHNLDTPERGHPLWKAASNRARELAPAPSEVLLRTYKDADKYGRWLADVQSELCDDVASVLVAEGLAVRYDGGTKNAW